MGDRCLWLPFKASVYLIQVILVRLIGCCDKEVISVMILVSLD